MPVATLQPDGAAGIDTYLDSGGPTSNFGTSGIITVGTYTTTNQFNTLIKFDLSSIPTNANVTSAKLSIYYFDHESTTHNAITAWVYTVKRNWIEDQATWNVYSTGNNWETAGGTGANDINTAAIASQTIPDACPEWVEWTIPPFVIQQMITGGLANNGFLISAGTSQPDYRARSSDYATPGERPKLTIEYVVGGKTIIWFS